MIQESDKPGKLDVEKAKKLGVKPGPDLGILKSGKSVIAVGTGQEVKPEDVLGEPIKGKKVRVSDQGVESLWGDYRFIPADWGS